MWYCIFFSLACLHFGKWQNKAFLMLYCVTEILTLKVLNHLWMSEDGSADHHWQWSQEYALVIPQWRILAHFVVAAYSCLHKNESTRSRQRTSSIGTILFLLDFFYAFWQWVFTSLCLHQTKVFHNVSTAQQSWSNRCHSHSCVFWFWSSEFTLQLFVSFISISNGDLATACADRVRDYRAKWRMSFKTHNQHLLSRK